MPISMDSFMDAAENGYLQSGFFIPSTGLDAYFHEHPDLYQALEKKARTEFRTPISHALYLLHGELLKLAGVNG
jgi:hypothetical protein